MILVESINYRTEFLQPDQLPVRVYSVEKLVDTRIPVDIAKLSKSNSLFLLRHLPAETSKFTELRVFQQNRPATELDSQKNPRRNGVSSSDVNLTIICVHS